LAHALLAEAFAVVAEHHDQRALGEAAPLEAREHLAEQRIRALDEQAVARPGVERLDVRARGLQLVELALGQSVRVVRGGGEQRREERSLARQAVEEAVESRREREVVRGEVPERLAADVLPRVELGEAQSMDQARPILERADRRLEERGGVARALQHVCETLGLHALAELRELRLPERHVAAVHGEQRLGGVRYGCARRIAPGAALREREQVRRLHLRLRAHAREVVAQRLDHEHDHVEAAGWVLLRARRHERLRGAPRLIVGRDRLERALKPGHVRGEQRAARQPCERQRARLWDHEPDQSRAECERRERHDGARLRVGGGARAGLAQCPTGEPRNGDRDQQRGADRDLVPA
jgi:hypothetical protein